MRDWLKDLRQKDQMTMAQMAEKMEVSESYYAYIESGERQKKMDILVISKLAEIFGLSIQEIADMETGKKGE